MEISLTWFMNGIGYVQHISAEVFMIAHTCCIVFAHIHLTILVNKRKEKVSGVSRNITCEGDFCCFKITKIM